MKAAILVILAVLLSACSAKLKVNLDASSVQRIAILPTKVNGDLVRERVALIDAQVRSQLSNSGFILIDQALLDEQCTATQCTKFAAQHRLDGIAQLTIDEASSSNFLAGYYKSVSGSLSLYSPSGQELWSVSHTERQKGGLLFNSGQVFQGLKSQVESGAGSEFAEVSANFARELLAAVPRPKLKVPAATEQLKITSVQVVPDRFMAHKVCVMGDPAKKAALVYGRRHSSLREISGGQYCGVFRLEDLGGKAFVELRTDLSVY